MGRKMLTTALSPAPTPPLEFLIDADPMPPIVRQAAWRWAALFRWAVPERVRATLIHGWRRMLAIETVNDHDAIGGADGPVNPAPANGLGAAIPAADTPLMGSLRGIFGHDEA